MSVYKNIDVDLLIEMLNYRRAAFSETEEYFVERFITYPFEEIANIDAFGNVIVDVGDNPNIIFSCHTDTCESRDGYRGCIIEANGFLVTTGDDILGADDGAGVYILTKMIEAGVKGRYIFHRAEEIGALGSTHILENTPELLSGITHAIAFDRKGTGDVVYSQLGKVMASPSCVGQLCGLLDVAGGEYKPAVGIFTDTAIYAPIVPECINISCGYYNEHTYQETLDLVHLDWLVGAAIALDWQSLKVGVREAPKAPKSLGDYYEQLERRYGR